MKQSIRQILPILTIAFLLASCAPAQPATSDAAEVANLVATSVALTVASQNLDTAEAAPPAATETPLPTATEVVIDTPTAVPPLDTPTAIPLPTTASSGGSGSGSVTTVRSEYSCDSINRRPYDNTVFKPNDTFDIKWTIVNNGTKTLRAGLDLKYSSGSKLMPNTVVELPELKPGAEYKVSFDGVAPSKEGTYIMIYTVEGGLCFPYTAIIVEK